MRFWPVLLIFLVACGSTATVDRDDCSTPVFTTGIDVACVIDGDTIRLSDGDYVRLIGIDTPEKGENGYTEATLALVAMINNTEIRLVKDTSETDKYGRLLRYVYAKQESQFFVNELMVKRGWARAVDYPPDSKNAELFAEAEKEARTKRAGLFR